VDDARATDDAAAKTFRAAVAALTGGRPAEAAALCRRVLERSPGFVDAHFLVGLVALELEDRPTAIRAFGTVTQLRPDHGAAWAQLAWLHARTGAIARADTALAEAIRHAGDGAAVADLIGTTSSLIGEQVRAREWFRRAVAAAPARIDYRINLANAEIFLGATDVAELHVRKVLEAEPGHAQAHWLLAGLRTARDRTHVAALEALAREPGRTARERGFLCYALGKELEDLGEWDAAFAALAEGARHRRSTMEWDEAAEIAHFDALTRTYTAEWLAARPPGDPDPGPIFVIGQPRTGTTLVERILAAHPDVHAAGELQQFGLAIRRLDRESARRDGLRPAAERVAHAANLDPALVGSAYLAACARQRGTRARFVDKLPGNFVHLPLIRAALPNARIVHLVRGPMDACFASFKQLFADAYPHSYDPREQARHFARYHALMGHWRREFPGQFLDVQYEALVADPEAGTRRLLEYLDLPWHEDCLDFHRVEGAVKTASAVQVREPAHTRSVGRWRRFAAHLEPMRATLAAAGIDPE
jgi:tetratricopeptide (TPR) repeat protein